MDFFCLLRFSKYHMIHILISIHQAFFVMSCGINAKQGNRIRLRIHQIFSVCIIQLFSQHGSVQINNRLYTGPFPPYSNRCRTAEGMPHQPCPLCVCQPERQIRCFPPAFLFYPVQHKIHIFRPKVYPGPVECKDFLFRHSLFIYPEYIVYKVFIRHYYLSVFQF